LTCFDVLEFHCFLLLLSLSLPLLLFGTPTQKGLQKRRRDTHTNTAMRQENTHTAASRKPWGGGVALNPF